MIRAIIFDCFGVIIEDALKAMCDELRLTDPLAADEVTDLGNMVNKDLMDTLSANRRIAEIFGLDLEAFRAKVRDGEARNGLLLEYIAGLRGQYKTAMLSNISTESLQRRFTPDELRRHFDTVVTSGEVGYAKPEPEIYQITAERLGLRFDECLFIDDREEYCQAARATGMQAIRYESFEQFTRDIDKSLP